MSSIIDQIKEKVDIVEVVSAYLDLQKKGRNFWGLCPFHEDKNPSMSVSPEKQMFKCFVCGKGGNVINFVADKEQISFRAALEILAQKVGIDYTNVSALMPKYTANQEKLINALNDANNFFQYQLGSSDYQNVQAYLKKRQIKQEISEKFAIGYAPNDEQLINFLLQKGHDEATLINASLMTQNKRTFFKNRLMFAIKNQFNDVIAFSGRVLDDSKPKYINSGESQVFNKATVFYNINHAYEKIKKQQEVFICEGFMDVIAFDQAKYFNVLALMGTALNQKHTKFLKNFQVTLILDADQAGLQASLKSIALLLYHQISTFVAVPSQGKDPDEIFQTHGEAGIKNLINKKISALAFVYEQEKKHFDIKTPQGIEQFIRKFGKYLTYANKIEQDFYLNQIAEEFKLNPLNIAPLIPQHQHRKITLAPVEDIKKPVFKAKNYSFILIRSMIAKPFLIDLLKTNRLNLSSDTVLATIIEYLVAIRQKEKVTIPVQYQQTILDIQSESNEIVTTEAEFIDLIKIINKNANSMLINVFNVKLNKATTPADKLKWLKMLQQVKKGKQK